MADTRDYDNGDRGYSPSCVAVRHGLLRSRVFIVWRMNSDRVVFAAVAALSIASTKLGSRRSWILFECLSGIAMDNHITCTYEVDKCHMMQYIQHTGRKTA